MFHHFPSVRLDCISCALGAYSKTKTKTPRGNMFQEPRSQGFQRFNPGLVHQSKQVSKDSLGATELKMLKPMNPLNEIQDVHFPHEPSGCSPRFRLPATTPSHPKKRLCRKGHHHSLENVLPWFQRIQLMLPTLQAQQMRGPTCEFSGQLPGEKGQQLDTPKKIMFKRLAICTFPSLDPISIQFHTFQCFIVKPSIFVIAKTSILRGCNLVPWLNSYLRLFPWSKSPSMLL